MDKNATKIAVHLPGLTRLEKVLILLLIDAAAPKKPSEIKILGTSVGLREIKGWNISSILSRSKGLAILVENGWELSHQGKQHLLNLGISNDPIVTQQAVSLRALIPNIVSAKNREFITEAVSCFENKCLRAAAVLSWVGAISILHDHVVQKKLQEFNKELQKRNPKRKLFTTSDDLADLKEDEFLDVIHAISIIGKSIKDELKGCLKYRNGCGHPNNLAVGETRVAAHLETLINNVYLKF